MGTINYITSDYITMGLEPVSAWDLERDTDFMQEIRAEVEQYGGTVDEAIYNYIADCEEDDMTNIETELDKHSFDYFRVGIEPGYYAGFSLDISAVYDPEWLDDDEIAEVEREIDSLGDFLRACAGLGLVACYPGWCTSYSDYKGTLRAIDGAVQAMRDELQNSVADMREGA